MPSRLKSTLSRLLPGAAFARSVATLTLGTAFAQALSVTAVPLLTRLYTPADFGFLAVFMAISGVVATAVTLRYETAVLPAKNEQESATIVLLCLACTAVLGILLTGVSVFLPTSALHLLAADDELASWLPAAVLTGANIAAMAASQAWLNRHKKYPQMAVLRVAQSTIIIGLGLIFGTVLRYQQGLVLAQMLACAVTAGITLWCARSATKFWRHADIKSVAHIHVNAPKYLLLTALLDTITLQLPVVLIASWFGQDMAGQFSMAWRVLMLPMGLIGAAVGQVFLQRFAEVQTQPQAARHLLIKTWRTLFFLGFLPMVLIFLFGENIFKWVLGDLWGEAGQIASIMAPMLLAMFISSPTSGTYVVLGLQRYGLFFGIGTFLYRTLFLFLGHLIGDFAIAIKAWVVIDVFVIALYQKIALHKINQSKQ